MDQGDLQAMMKELCLNEDYFDNVVFENEAPPRMKATRWTTIARMHTNREWSMFWFYKNMRVSWDVAQEVKIKYVD